MDLVGKAPNLMVARTFSKAYGLAGLRLGMLAAPLGMQQWLRTVISPYSVNSLALACLPAALDDDAYLQWYVGEVKAARAEMAENIGKLGVPQWPSRANFILVKIGPKHTEFVQAMQRRGSPYAGPVERPGLRRVCSPDGGNTGADEGGSGCHG